MRKGHHTETPAGPAFPNKLTRWWGKKKAYTRRGPTNLPSKRGPNLKEETLQIANGKKSYVQKGAKIFTSDRYFHRMVRKTTVRPEGPKTRARQTRRWEQRLSFTSEGGTTEKRK